MVRLRAFGRWSSGRVYVLLCRASPSTQPPHNDNCPYTPSPRSSVWQVRVQTERRCGYLFLLNQQSPVPICSPWPPTHSEFKTRRRNENEKKRTDDDRILNQRPRGLGKRKMHRILRQIIIQVRLAPKLQHEAVRHALSMVLPGHVLARFHRRHVRLAGVLAYAFRGQREEGVEVRLQLRPRCRGRVFEEDDVRDWRRLRLLLSTGWSC